MGMIVTNKVRLASNIDTNQKLNPHLGYRIMVLLFSCKFIDSYHFSNRVVL